MAAFAGLFLMMLFFFLYANSFQGGLEKVTIQLQSVKIHDQNKIEKRANLDVSFYIQNPTSTVLTISTINYELYANGIDLGEGHFTTEDIPEAGRPALFANGNLTLPTSFNLVNSDKISDQYLAIVNNQPLKFEAKGQVTIESFLTAVVKDFDVNLG